MTRRGFQNLKTKALKEMYRIGCCYEHGDGVDKDEVEAVKWYRMAANQGFVSAIFALSKCYALGIGVRRNRVAATKLLSKCADKGDVVSMRILGICYQEGRGVERSPRKAA